VVGGAIEVQPARPEDEPGDEREPRVVRISRHCLCAPAEPMKQTPGEETRHGDGERAADDAGRSRTAVGRRRSTASGVTPATNASGRLRISGDSGSPRAGARRLPGSRRRVVRRIGELDDQDGSRRPADRGDNSATGSHVVIQAGSRRGGTAADDAEEAITRQHLRTARTRLVQRGEGTESPGSIE